jgi:D-arabinose 1-dehydrogenase-like Zn-dependent alcohol dehydrogenase
MFLYMMRVAQVSRPGGPLELVERPIPDPGPGSVRIKVQACGVCHSDAMTKEGLWPGITFLRIPGPEVVGVIDAVGFTVVALAGPKASVVFMQAFGAI